MRISETIHVPVFVAMLPVVVAPSSSGDVVLPVLWMTSFSHNRSYSAGNASEVKSECDSPHQG